MNVVIGIPTDMTNRANANTVAIASAWAKDDGVNLMIESSPSPVEGRDKIVQKCRYMIPQPTHILFLDADVVPRKNTLRVLLHEDKDIITGVYPMYQRGWLWSVSRNGDFVLPKELPQNPFKVTHCGFGVVLVRMDVLEKMNWPYWKDEYAPGARITGEDVYFCRNAQSAGFDIWCDPKVKCNHIRCGNYLSMMKG